MFWKSATVGKTFKNGNVVFSIEKTDRDKKYYYFKTTLIEPNIFFLPEKQVMYGSIFLHHVGERNMLPQMYEVYSSDGSSGSNNWNLGFGIIFEDFLKWSTLKVLQKCEKSSTVLNIWQKIEENWFFDWSLPSTDYTIT